MRERAGDALRMQIGAFLGCPTDPKEARALNVDRPVDAFIEWLEKPLTASTYTNSLITLTRRSILEGDHGLVGDARDAIETLAASFVHLE